jgi:general secretion pathway protein H
LATFLPTTKRLQRRGMTLIEIIVVLAVVAVMVASIAVSFGSWRDAELSSGAGKVRGAMRYLYNLAIVNNRPYRLVVDMDNRKYWGEALMENDPCQWFLEEPDEEKKERSKEYARTKADDDRAETRSNFVQTKESLLEPRDLPRGVYVTGVLTENLSTKITSGMVAIHFFPSGRAEKAYLWMGVGDPDSEDGVDERVTLELQGLMGRVTQHTKVLSESSFHEERRL